MKYIDANGVEQTADNATEITTNTTTLTAEQGDKWYYVTGTVDLTSDPSLITSISLSGSGTAHLILGDGATLKATGISNSATTDEATSLVIYAQSTGDNAGTLDITNSNSSASIFVKGGVTINGGTVNVETTSENGGAYIRSDNGDVEINGGKVNIDSENSGTYIQGNSVTINGGKVNIDSDNSEAYIKSDSGNVEITYGTVNVKGATLAYISSNGGTVTINGSTVAVEGTGDNAGAYIMTTGDNGTVTINGGQIKITGTGSQTSGIICGSIKSINLDYQDIKYDFILTSGYWCSASTGNTFIYPIIASGKAFAVMGGEEFTDFERFINSTNYTEFNYATLLKDKKLVPALTVTFDANDGTSAPATQTQNVRYEIDSTLTENTFTRTGYTFKGWNTQADGNGTSYADKANVTLTADTTLYAQWQQQETTPPAATLSTIEVSVTGESTLSTTEGTATTSAYTASVTGKYS